MKDENILLALIAVFVPYSLVSIGGAPSVFAGMQHQAVDVHHWLTAREFVDMFAISRAAPGPGSLLSTLIGWQIAGWSGAIIATLAFYVPSSLICYGIAFVWRRHRGKSWHTALEQGLAPVGIGLILAGILALFRVSGGGALAWLVAFGSAGMMTWRPKLHPLLIFAIGGAIFVALHAMNWDRIV